MPVVVADQNYTSNEPTKQDMIDKYEEGDLVDSTFIESFSDEEERSLDNLNHTSAADKVVNVSCNN